MALFFCFILGIGNFAMHRAVMESRHPLVEHSRIYFGRIFGRWGSYAIEFAMLLGAMIFAQSGSVIILAIYGAYTLLNGIAAYMLLSGRA